MMRRDVLVIKRQKPEEEDRISALPDCPIQHILSYLPSTKQAIQSGILSKRWRHQWSRVPLLLFDSTGTSDQTLSRFIDRTLLLHDCCKIKKFQIKIDTSLGSDLHLAPKLLFATRKPVEELVLHLSTLDKEGEVYKNRKLPEFLFNNDSFVKLELFRCYFSQNQSANWSNLKELRLDCSYVRLSFKNILPGCPVLELLEITNARWYPGAVFASKSLKKLSFIDFCEPHDTFRHRIRIVNVEISCPNLEELCIKTSQRLPILRSRLCNLWDKTIGHVLSGSPFLSTLELSGFICHRPLVIASNSLKKLVVGRLYLFPDLEISCPCLEEFRLHPFMLSDSENIDKKSLAEKILRQLQHVKLLDIGGWVIQFLKVEDSSSLLLNCKCLALDCNGFDRLFSRIVSVIRCSPLLEKLVIKFPPNQIKTTVASSGLTDSGKKNSSNSDGVVINCSVSNLKTVEIIGLSERDDNWKHVFNFVEFLLKNGRVLEKIVFILGECGKGFIFYVSEKLLSFPRYSPSTQIKLY